MDNYENALQTDEGKTVEDHVSKTVETVEHYTAALPSSAYFGIAVGAMAASLALHIAGRGRWGNFIAQWAPALLILGVYNKLVKLEGHDPIDRPHNRGYTG